MNRKQKFFEELNKESYYLQAQFKLEDEDPLYRFDIWGIISISTAIIIIKISKEALPLLDKVLDVIIKVYKRNLIPIEIKCPDGTKIHIEVPENNLNEKLEMLKKMC